MLNFMIGGGPRKYVKCSNCKVFDAISQLYTNPKCDRCHQPLKEISEEEYKQKLANLRKYKEERKKKRENNNNNYRNDDNRPRNNSSLHSSKIQFNDDNNNINNNNNNNINININNNINHNQRGIRVIKIVGGGHHGNHIRMGRDNSSDRENNSHHRHHHKMIIIRPSTHHHSNNNNNNNQNNIIITNNNNMNMNQNIFDNQPGNNRNPFRILIQRHHVSNDVFDPSFNLFGSTFNHIFQENFSSNFRSNFRGNYLNEVFNIISFNRAEANRKKQHPISEQNIQKLKKFNLTEHYCKKGENGKFEKPNCCICLEEIELGKETVLLPCGHMFHSDCCLTWLKKSNTCPICRFEIK